MFFVGCSNDNSINQNIAKTENKIPQYKYLSSKQTGVDFSNILDEPKMKNPFNYINAYNGGGVAVVDLDNDGLQDIIFTGNMVPGKVYKNKGNLKFEDITDQTGIILNDWTTGIAVADINNDGWQDIYICKSYEDDPKRRANLMYINKQDGTFREAGAQLGLNDQNYSIGASFLDYDRDGDLDLIVANHPRYRLINMGTHIQYFKNPVPQFSSRLFRNDGNKFSDVTQQSGVLSYGFCLGGNYN